MAGRDLTKGGLCETCTFLRRVPSSRGAEFYLCGRSFDDPAFPKYPVLPVLACRGWTPVDFLSDPSTTTR